MPPRWHRLDDQLFAALEDQHDGLEEPGTGVEAKPELTVWPLVLLDRLDPQ